MNGGYSEKNWQGIEYEREQQASPKRNLSANLMSWRKEINYSVDRTHRGNEGASPGTLVVVVDELVCPHPSPMQIVATNDTEEQAMRSRQASENRLRAHLQTIARLVRQLQTMQGEMRRQVAEVRRESHGWRDGKW